MDETLTKSIEDYLEAIYMFELKGNTPLKSLDLANFLNVSKPAVTKAMNKLIEDNFIIKKNYGSIILTDLGREIAMKVYDKHISIKDFLINIGVSKETAEKDCCLIEHVISEETFLKIKEINFNLEKTTQKGD